MYGASAFAGDRRATATMLPLPPGRNDGRNETYIVQFQKDQIYQVPPPQNTTTMEKYRNPKDFREGRCCPNLLLTITLTLLAIVAIIAITITILYLILSPKGPIFSITNFVVKNPNTQPKYQFSLNVKNPNKMLGLEYRNNAQVLLLFEKRRVATGKLPRLDQDPGDWDMVMVDLNGFDGTLPPQMEKSMKSNDTPIALGLDMQLRVRIAAARLETWVMKFNVACVFEVNTLRNDTRVLSQECETSFKQS